MKVSEAKALVLDLIVADISASSSPLVVDPTSPDPRDPNKFLLGGKVARPIHRFSGWFVPVNPDWFSGGSSKPTVHGFPFHWYVFAIPRQSFRQSDHYIICDYMQMRDWVLDFAAPRGRDYRNQPQWRADVSVSEDESEAYFRWGDEPAGSGRLVDLDNATTLQL